jgi:hypothetical protein
MAFTRFKYDDCRTKKELQQSTGPGRWILNVPGNGDKPCFIEDPQIIIQKWGANLKTNSINLESELRCINRPLTRDCIGLNNYKNHQVKTNTIKYPDCNNLFTEQSRSTNPAWWYRDLEQTDWGYPPLNPQENTCLSFNNNLNTRLLEKDYFVAKNECVETNSANLKSLPINFNSIKGGYSGGPKTCQQTNSCESI